MLTPRLRLHSLDLPGYAALRAGREVFARYIGARLDPEWPTFGGHLGYFEEAILADPGLAGWATWVAVHVNDGVVIGEGGYKGAPDAEGGDSAASQGVLRNLGFTRGVEAEEEGMRVVSWEARRQDGQVA